jgi:Tol biopolymer transport system component
MRLELNRPWRAAPLFLGLLLLIGCSSETEPNPTFTSAALPSVSATPLPADPAPETPGAASATPQATPTSTQAPTATATATATPSPSPTPTVTPSPTPTPTPQLRRLTSGGCCTQPFWAPDSERILYIDRPEPDGRLGIWEVGLEPPDAVPQLLIERIALYTSDLAYLVDPVGGQTFIERLGGTGGEDERWTVPAGGRPVSISPGRTRISWQVSNDDAPAERRVTQVWVANLDGTDPQEIATLPRGGVAGWVSEDVLLLSGRVSLDTEETVIFTQSLVDGTTVELVRTQRPRGTVLSPDGSWLAYYITFSDDPAENGLWLVRSDGSERRQLDGDLFGSYQWRDSRRLILIPFRPDASYHEFWEVDAETGQARRLTDPSVTPFKIANGDWQISPDGLKVAFVEDEDRNIWVLTLPD